MVLCIDCFWLKCKKIKPSFDKDLFNADVEGSVYEYSMVLIQILMCNEKEVYEQSISAICQIDWPKDHFLAQVLDDSDNESIKWLIKAEVSKWSQRGINIIYRHHLVRTSYKAGNLKSAMSCDYVKRYEFVAIFYADFQPNLIFQPNHNFLKQTVTHFKMGDPSVEVTDESRDESQMAKSLAMEALTEGELEKEIERLTKAILLNLTSTIMHGTRASVYIKMKKLNTAIRDANAAL
ncbi:hypothetical protein GIB67_003770 [Kingdonia uniflora]|uniref:Uncharacterized protein n=1 Tax=Kingdonia uniflora TaxID=39325 RepID=A0A7J7MIT9_9MAGN|nr:hypothetical protein GIB67_003770 [Kingdonia uniflora]